MDTSRTDVWHPCRLPVMPGSMPVSLSGQSCFPCRLVNGDAFHSTERLSPASGRPPAVPTLGCFYRASLLDTFRRQLPFLAGFLLLASSPWAPPAATGEACLEPMSLPGFCNHAKDRAHQTDVRTSPRNSVSGGSESRSPTGHRSVVSDKGIPATNWYEPCRPKSPESACARRQQRPTRIRSNAPLSPSEARSELETLSASRPAQAPLGPTARTVTVFGKARGAFRRSGPGLECLSLPGVADSAAETTEPGSALFSRTGMPPP